MYHPTTELRASITQATLSHQAKVYSNPGCSSPAKGDYCFPGDKILWGQDKLVHLYQSQKGEKNHCMASPPAWTNSAGMLFTPADFPIFSALTAASTSSRRIGWCSVLLGPLSLIVVKVWAELCPPVKDFIFFRETLPRLVLYDCSFTLFLCCQFLD